MILFGATVNNETRTVQIDEGDVANWVVTSINTGDIEDDDLDEVELAVMNSEYYYSIFYEGASQDDYDADLIDRSIEIV